MQDNNLNIDFNNEDMTVNSLLDAISEIEIRALGNLEGKDLDNVMYYAEISKSSLEYFCSECDLSESRGIFSRIRKKIS